jgi:hypothetical protein
MRGVQRGRVRKRPVDTLVSEVKWRKGRERRRNRKHTG